MRTPLSDFELPAIMLDFLVYFSHGVSISVILNYTDGLNGYGIKEYISISVRLLVSKCTRDKCDYHSLYHSESSCKRCLIKHDYEEIFSWYSNSSPLSLEKAFENYLRDNLNLFCDELKKGFQLILKRFDLAKEGKNV